MTKSKQLMMHCPCGNHRIRAAGLCSACYKRRGWDKVYFGGHQEAVLKRDGYRCRVPGCTTVKRGKRSVAVHHRQPGKNDPAKMLTLCLACHAKVTRTLFLQSRWPEFLRVLWREQHPRGKEQSALNFATLTPPAKDVPLFTEMEGGAAFR